MCTVTLIPLPRTDGRPGSRSLYLAGSVSFAGFRLVVNRDEERDRPAASPPRWHDLPQGSTRAVYPIDPVGGGTWVGVSSTGLALCLLNLNQIPRPYLPPPEQLTSRGLIIPKLLGLSGTAEIARVLRQSDLDFFAPFRVLAIDPPRPTDEGGSITAIEAVWDRLGLRVRRLAAGPLCLVSSGLGDTLAAPRLALFDRMLSVHGATPVAQDRFHRQQWPDRPEISVLMARDEARTVSITTAEVVWADGLAASSRHPRVSMTYEGLVEGAVASACVLADPDAPAAVAV
ncbi:MAG: NRDE family protein [Phycisphaerales bacterium]|nr:NRDE family protein [Phycisphaerales bacterium]